MGEGKTVYILGAGFSIPAGLPSQDAILSKVFESNTDSFDECELLLRTEAEYHKARLRIARFLIRMFSGSTEQDIIPNLEKNLSEDDFPPSAANKTFEYAAANLSYISLEDIFTTIDKAIITGENVHYYNTGDLFKLRESLILCILRVFSKASIQHSYQEQQYKKFADFILSTRLADFEKDLLAIITLNWDSILDTYLAREIRAKGERAGIDYCVYDYDYNCCCANPSKTWCPSTHLKRSGIANIKLLKLHGALNWLTCTNCHRLFYSYEENIGLRQFFRAPDEARCPFCAQSHGKVRLKCNLGTPTMLKTLDDVNLRNIWGNAFVELTETERVVFIGYSFPQADYEFRYMVKRALNPNAAVEVVLIHHDAPEFFNGLGDPDMIEHIIGFMPASRYNSFFGRDRVVYHYNGLEGYLDSIL